MRSIDQIKTIYIEKALIEEETALVYNILERRPKGTQIEYTEEPQTLLSHFRQHGKQELPAELLVYRHKGHFFSSCPGSDGMVCCQYFVLNLGQGCLYDCHYCYLQSFLNNPLMTLFGNLEDLFRDLDQSTRGKNFHFRIGTGEYTDSLALEPLTGQASLLVNYFAHHPNATLELKTKSSHVEGLLELEHRGHTVVSWSLNPACVIEAVEEGTASLTERLEAAQKVEAAGYKVGFHLDPLIYFENWESEYHALIDLIFSYLRPNSVAWISAGSFRYTPALKELIQARFPEDELSRSGEMVQGSDGKYRYFKTVRQEMFASIRKKINSVDPRLFLYLCMESKRMWQNVFDFVPDSGKKLDALFEERRKYLAAQASA